MERMKVQVDVSGVHPKASTTNHIIYISYLIDSGSLICAAKQGQSRPISMRNYDSERVNKKNPDVTTPKLRIRGETYRYL